MTRGYAAILFVFVLQLSSVGMAQESVRFRRLSIQDGLSQSTVEAIVQDDEGFMWFGTEDGLNRYDGYTFTQFRHDPDDPGSISSNNIWCLHVDRGGSLWIGTFSGGLNRWEPATETFTRFQHDPNDPAAISSNRIRCIAEDERGDLWIGMRDGGLDRMPAGTREFLHTRHAPQSALGLSSDNVRFVLPDRDGALWIATNRGFSRLDTGRNEIEHFRAGLDGDRSLPSNNVRHLLRDSRGAIWVSTAEGLSRFDPVDSRFTNFRHDPNDPTSISADSIRRTFEDGQGRLWVCTTNGGLNLYDSRTGGFAHFRHDDSNPLSLSNDAVRVAYEDEGGLLWVGTIGGGLSVYDPQTDRYRHYRYDPKNARSLSDRIVWAVAEGPNSELWFGTPQGVDRVDRETGRIENIRVSPMDARAASRDDYTRSLTWDDAGRLWVGRLYTGVDVYDPDRGVVARLRHREGDDSTISSNNVRAVYQDERGAMWIGTWRGGLDRYDPDSGTFAHFRHRPDDTSSLSNDNVVTLLQDSDGTYWIATARGLNRLVFEDTPAATIGDVGRRAKITRFLHDPTDLRTISNDYVLTIHEASNGDLWFGTMLGLCRLRSDARDDPVFDRYLMKHGLPSDVVYGILEDDRGRLWLSTNYGVSCFDPAAGAFDNYDSRDGLLGNEYNTGAFTRRSTGEFVFGGVGGASEFHPDNIVDSPYASPVVLTGFDIFDQPARLDGSLADLQEIILSYRDNFFSFEFAALDYSAPDRNRYLYMLEGLDRTWIHAGTRNYAGYTRVDAGSYTFRVKATNGDGIWSDRTASVRVVITPPFWKTWWFILLLILAVGGGVAGLITARVRQLLAVERLRSKIAADLHDDIGAGLTEIAMMGHVISRKLPSESRELVEGETERVRRTARKLIAGMSDIVWLVDPGCDSLYDLISRLSDAFSQTLNAQGIRFRAENLDSLKSVRLKMDHRQHLLLIFKEAINNSLKYSRCSEIHLMVDLDGSRLTVRLSDDGGGFDPSTQRMGNGLKNMRERAGRIGGEVIITSSLTSGTVVEYSGSIR